MDKLNDSIIIHKIARELGLKRYKDCQSAIREFCTQKIENIKDQFGSINNLSTLLDVVSSFLGICFEEVHDDNDIEIISNKYLAQGEYKFADLSRELDASTDAVMFSLTKIKKWKYAAVIDCRGIKIFRAYFSKWHEVAHILTRSPQTFLFHRAPKFKRDPEEMLVDRIAGDLAFYTPLFLPELLVRTKTTNRLTFDIIEELREIVCPGASRAATIRGAISRAPFPQLMVIADYGLKKSEEEDLFSKQGVLFKEGNDQYYRKLRAVEVIVNKPALKIGLWVHKNMEVPQESVIRTAYEEFSPDEIYHNRENLNWWKHSRGGQLNDLSIDIEAKLIGDRVYAFINMCP